MRISNTQTGWLAGLILAGWFWGCSADRVGVIGLSTGGSGGSSSNSTGAAAHSGAGGEAGDSATGGGSTGGTSMGGSGGSVGGSGGSVGGSGGSVGGSGGSSTTGGAGAPNAPTIPSATPDLLLEFGDALAGAGVSALEIDAEDNVVIAGYFGGDIDFGSGVRHSEYSGLGTGSLFAAKLSSEGEVVWSTVFPVSTCCSVTDLSIDTQGDVILVGGVNSDSDFGAGLQENIGVHDAFITKLRGANGRLVFSRRYGSAGADIPLSVVTDAENNIYTAGGFAGPVSFEPEAKSVDSERSMFVAGFEPNGTLDWVTSFEVTQSSMFTHLEFEAPNKLLVSGNLFGPVLFDGKQIAPLENRSSGLLVELDLTGQLLKAQEIVDGGTLEDARGAEAAVFVSGTHTLATEVGGQLIEPWATYGSPYVAKLDRDGQASWVTNFAELSTAAELTQVHVLRRDQHQMLHALIGVVESDPIRDTVRFVTLGPDGQLLRTRTLGGLMYGMAVDSKGAVWIGGDLREPFDFGDGPRAGPLVLAKYTAEAWP